MSAKPGDDGSALRMRVVIGLCLLVLAGAAVKGTSALLLGRTTHPGNTVSAVAIYDPSAITVVGPVDNTEVISWTAPANNNGNGYAILAYHQGPASAACSTTLADYTFVKGVASNVTTYTDNGVFAGSNANFQASYTCYMVRTWLVPGVAPASWTGATVPAWTGQLAPVPATQYVTPTGVSVGFFVTSVTMTNGNKTMAQNDTLVINYNQATNAPDLTTPGQEVCARPGAVHTIYIGQIINNNTCDIVGGSSVGVLAGGTYTNAQDSDFAATFTWSNGNKTLTVTLGQPQNGNPTNMNGTWTFTPSVSAQAGQPLVRTASTTVTACNANHTVVEGIPPGSSQTNVCLRTTATTF